MAGINAQKKRQSNTKQYSTKLTPIQASSKEERGICLAKLVTRKEEIKTKM